MTYFGVSTCIRSGCGTEFIKKRARQRYCSTKCRVGDAVGRHRSPREAITTTLQVSQPRRSDYRASTGFLEAPEPPSEAISYGWGEAGDPILRGDEYQLEYYADGYPKLPDILKRRLH
jgi:hypothetical protein